MKTQFHSHRRLAQFLTAALWLAAVVPRLFATGGTNVSEPPSFSTTSPGTAYVLQIGTNSFSGSVATPSAGQKFFQVTVPVGTRLTKATMSFASGGGVEGAACTFNSESISGPGTGTFANGYPLAAGTYQASANADFSVGNAWSMSFVVGPAPNFVVSSLSGYISISDSYTNNDTLSVTQAVAGTIAFTATGQTFTVNNGALLTNSTGNISLSGATDVEIDIGSSNDTVNVSGFSGSAFPNLAIYSGAGNDTVNLNGGITFASGNYLDVELQDGSPATNTVNVGQNADLVVSGTGTITVLASQGISLNSGAGFQVQNGDLDVEANQQSPATTGNFIGVNLSGATMKSTGAGQLFVAGQGGADPGGYQLGVQLINAGQIIGGATGDVTVQGAGGNNTGIVNRGVTVYGSNSVITSSGAPISVVGNAGTNGSYYGIGVSVLFGGQVTAGGTANVVINGTGAGDAGSGYNQGLEMSEPGSLITSTGGNVTINGTAGPGGSSGIYMANSGAISTGLTGKSIVFYSDSVSVDSTSSISTTNLASGVEFAPGNLNTSIDLGGADVAGNPATLGLTAAELSTVRTDNLIISNGGSGNITISAPITLSTVTNLTLLPGSGGVIPAASGTDLSLSSGTVKIPSGSLVCAINGPTVDSDYSQLNVAGRVNLNGTSLVLTGSYAGGVGAAFTLINNDGADPVIGTFKGLPEGTFLKVNGQPARIYYDGGTGNDVILVRTLPQLTASNLTGGHWSFSGVGFPTNTYTIQATTNFLTWTNLGAVLTDTNGNMTFTDSNASKFPYRFYRTTN